MPAGDAARPPFLFSAKYDHVGTPPAIIDDVAAHFGIDYDPCPLRATFDGLARPWGRANFVNPPYSALEAWLRAGAECGEQCVFLVPARLASDYWQRWVWPYAPLMYMFTERIQFLGYDAPFATPMVLLVYHPRRVPRVIERIGGIPVVALTQVHACAALIRGSGSVARRPAPHD